MVGRLCRRLLVIACLAAFVPMFTPSYASAVVVTADRLLADSVDDYIGGDVRTDLTDADASFGFITGAILPGEIKVSVENSDESWTLSFVPPSGETLEVGHYEADSRVAFSPEIRINANSNGCGASTVGSFTIQQLDRDLNGDPVAFAATFEQWCDSNIGPLVGLVRVNSDVPQAVLSTPQASRTFGNITTGESSGPRTFTIESLGELGVDVEGPSITGGGAGDFTVSDDACTDTSLDTGETCSFDVAFNPSATGERMADLVIANDAPEGARVLPLRGYGRIPTITTVSVEPDWEYIQPGIRLVSHVMPTPGGSVEYWYDDELAATGGLDAGSGFSVVPRELGSHTFTARYLGTVFHGGSQSSELTFEVSETTTVDLVLSKTTVPTGVPITLTATVGTASDLLYPGGTVTFRDATTNQVLATRSIDFGSSNPSIVASFTPGSHQIEATYDGIDGILDVSSDVATLSVLPDTIAPSSSTPTVTPRVGGSQSPHGGLPVRLSWTGSDNLSGIARYEVQGQTDGGAWSNSSNVTTASFNTVLFRGHDYRFRVRPIDYAGNIGAYRYGLTVRFRRYPDYANSVHYSPSWRESTGYAWWGGSAMKSSTSGARARFTIIGRSFAWIGLYAPSRGRASIYVNGVYKGTVDLYAASQQAQVVAWSKTWATSATRTIEIRVRGTHGRPRVDVDEFWVGS